MCEFQVEKSNCLEATTTNGCPLQIIAKWVTFAHGRPLTKLTDSVLAETTKQR